MKEEVLNFQIPPLERSPSAQPCSSQLRAKWLLCSTRFFAFVSSLKLSRRLLCGVRFVFVSTFSGGIWKFRTSSFRCYVDYPHIMHSSGNIDVGNWVHLFESRCIIQNYQKKLNVINEGKLKRSSLSKTNKK